MSRRELKKHETMQRIMAVAGGLFASDGYEATKIEDIADGAGVSPGTIYNYFGTKGAILVAVASLNIDSSLDHAAAALDLQAADPVDALAPVIDIYLSHIAAMGKDLLKEMIRAGFDPAASEMLAELVSLDFRVMEQLEMALTKMQDGGWLSSNVEVGSASMLVYSVLGGASIWYASDPELSVGDVADIVRSQLVLVFAGIGRH